MIRPRLHLRCCLGSCCNGWSRDPASVSSARNAAAAVPLPPPDDDGVHVPPLDDVVCASSPSPERDQINAVYADVRN